jgi:hypothetical protein
MNGESHEKSHVRIVGVPKGIRRVNLQNTCQKYYFLSRFDDGCEWRTQLRFINQYNWLRHTRVHLENLNLTGQGWEFVYLAFFQKFFISLAQNYGKWVYKQETDEKEALSSWYQWVLLSWKQFSVPQRMSLCRKLNFYSLSGCINRMLMHTTSSIHMNNYVSFTYNEIWLFGVWTLGSVMYIVMDVELLCLPCLAMFFLLLKVS